MPRYKLTIAYDGTDFCGWQKQEPPADMEVEPGKVLGAAERVQSSKFKVQSADAAAGEEPVIEPTRETGSRERIVLRTVQEVVERAVREVVNEPVEVRGASRTDAGVHARGQVAAFTCSGRDEETERRRDEVSPLTPLPLHPFTPSRSGWPLSRGTDRLMQAINARLPEDVLVVGAEVVHDSFDPISDCVAKGYPYTLHVSRDRPLFDRRFVHHVWVPLDVDAMRRAAERIVGEHDFAAFAKAGHGRETTVRTVFGCGVVESGTSAHQHSDTGAQGHRGTGDWSRRLRIEVSGNGFLYNMVRIIAGTLVEVGRGRLTPDDVSATIESQDRRRAGPTLPPHGLCLEWVRYPRSSEAG